MPTLFRRDPERLPPPSRVAIHYTFAGREGAPPLVLIPGWTLNASLWETLVPKLENRFRVLRFDPRGTGRSTSDPRLEHSRPADAGDLGALLDGLGVGACHLLGHSKGARTAAVFAMGAPSRALSAVFVGSAEPHGRGRLERDFRPVAHAWVEEIRRLAREEGVEKAVARLQTGRLFGKLRASPEAMRQLHRAMEGYRGADLITDTPARFFDTEAAADRLAAPVLVLCGEEDPFLAECRYAAQRLPDARLEILPRCGHMPMLERPAAFLDALERFYDTIGVM